MSNISISGSHANMDTCQLVVGRVLVPPALASFQHSNLVALLDRSQSGYPSPNPEPITTTSYSCASIETSRLEQGITEYPVILSAVVRCY
jgi:hypothetical protein